MLHCIWLSSMVSMIMVFVLLIHPSYSQSHENLQCGIKYENKECFVIASIGSVRATGSKVGDGV